MIPQSLLCFAWASAVFAASLHGRQQSNAAYSFGVPGVHASFDYVIVGGGTAGLALATRLAENSSISVAVVEAGGFYEADNGNISTTPAYDVFFAGTDANDTQPLVDWGFVTEPQAVCICHYQSRLLVDILQGADNRKLHYARGKTLGGSSARNFMLYHRQVDVIE